MGQSDSTQLHYIVVYGHQASPLVVHLAYAKYRRNHLSQKLVYDVVIVGGCHCMHTFRATDHINFVGTPEVASNGEIAWKVTRVLLHRISSGDVD